MLLASKAPARAPNAISGFLLMNRAMVSQHIGCPYCPSCEAAYRSGSRETLITPCSGLFISSIRKIAPDTDSAQTSITVTTVELTSDRRPKHMKKTVSQSMRIARNAVGRAHEAAENQPPGMGQLGNNPGGLRKNQPLIVVLRREPANHVMHILNAGFALKWGNAGSPWLPSGPRLQSGCQEAAKFGANGTCFRAIA